MTREEAIEEIKGIAHQTDLPLPKLIRSAFTTAGMMRDEGMSRRVEEAVAVLVFGPSMQRPTGVLICEAPIEGELAETPLDQLFPNQAVQGSLALLADADEAYVFRGDKAATLKHRDRAPEDVHVAIQRWARP